MEHTFYVLAVKTAVFVSSHTHTHTHAHTKTFTHRYKIYTSPLFLVLAAAFLLIACCLAATKFTIDREVCSFVDDTEGVADSSLLWAGLPVVVSGDA